MSRRTFVAGATALGLSLAIAGAPAMAQDYPTRPVRLVVPAAAGGVTDLAARIVARRLARELGQPVVVENRAGGGGRIGAADVAQAKADGYTLLYANAVTNALLPSAVRNIAYDPLRDFAPLGLLFSYTTVLVCNPAVPFNTVPELIDFARRHPGRLTLATAGPGSGNHFTNELFDTLAGVKTLSVHYKGNAPAISDVIGGVADCSHQGEVKQYVDSGRVKALATGGRQRDPRFPAVPTIAESGLPGYELNWWQGMAAPVATAPEVLARLTRAIQVSAADAEVQASMRDLGLMATYHAPAEMEKVMRADIARFRKIAADAKIVLD